MEDQADSAQEDRVNMRSKGQQARSRERVEQVPNAAESLVVESGMEGLKMRELARRAGLPIASLYHYFPSSSSVVRALAVRHLDSMREVLRTGLPEIMQPQPDAEARARNGGRLVARIARYLLATPASAAIWDSLRATPELRQLDMEDTARHARELEPYLQWVAPTIAPEVIPSLTIVLLEAVQANLIVIMHSPKTVQATLTDAAVAMITATLRGFQVMGDFKGSDAVPPAGSTKRHGDHRP